MPIVKVLGFPKQFGSTSFERVVADYKKEIVRAVLSVAELELDKESDVSVFFPSDFTSANGEELIIEITGLFAKPGRTPKVRAKLAASVGVTVQSFYPNARVECFVAPSKSVDGFWSSSM